MASTGERRSWLPFGLSIEQLTIWAVVFGLVWVLRDFFSIVFMTYIMSYVAQRVVGFLTRDHHPERSERWTRKPVVGIVYLTALALGYLFVQTVFPLAVDQGRALLEKINMVDLASIRDDLLAMTVGRLEVAHVENDAEFKSAQEAYVREHARPMSFETAKRTADQVLNAFQADLVRGEAAVQLQRLRQAPDSDEQYRRWLLVKDVERDLTSDARLRDQLYEEYDRDFALTHEAMFKQIKDQQFYKDDRHAAVAKKLTDKYFGERRDHDKFEQETAQANATVRLGTMPAAEKVERLRAFYRNEVPHLFPDLRLSFDDFKALETIGNEEQYRAKFKSEEKTAQQLEAEFRWQEQLKRGRKHPMATVVADSSNVLRENLPELTGWLTHAINNVLTFCLRALLSLGLSFMIIWEMPHIRRGLVAVQGTRIEPLYLEIAPTLARLGEVIGIAFSAQFLIASIDATLAFVALKVIGVGSAVFLSLVVLICCLIPYIGAFFAAVPVLLLALKDGGLGLATQAAVALLFIHELEAWILSPKILGEFLRLSPILVVAILCIAEPLFGIWGLLLGVPVAVYLINDVLLKPVKPDAPEPPAATPPPAA